MRNISTKADNVGDVLPATAFNALNSELENVVTSSGQTLDPEGGPDTDIEMLGKAITIYSNAGQYYQDSGAANAYVLARTGNLKPLVAYRDGTTVLFKAGNANTGASTINVDSLGSKALRDNNDVALVGGEILTDHYVMARYNIANDRFELIYSQQYIVPELTLPDDIGKSLVVADDGSGSPRIEVTETPGKNLLINSSLRIAQFGSSYQHSVNGNTYPFDGIRAFASGGVTGDFTIERSSIVPILSKSNYSLKIATATQQTTPAAADIVWIASLVEGLNVPLLNYASADAKNLVCSFWVRSTDTGNHSFYLSHQGTTATYPFQINISSADTWEPKTVVITGDQTQAINYDNTVSLSLTYVPIAGSDYYTSAVDTWYAGSSDRATSGDVNLLANASGDIYISDLKLELNNYKTPYIPRDYVQLERLAFRYRESGRAFSTGGANTTRYVNAEVNFQVEKRDVPTITYTDFPGTASLITEYRNGSNTNGVTPTNAPVSVDNKSVNCIHRNTVSAIDGIYYNWVADSPLI